MTDILTRLKAATGPDRLIDQGIYNYINGPLTEADIRHLDVERDIPHYTESLDAALTLVPHEYDWQILNAKEHGEERECEVQMWKGSYFDGKEGGDWIAEAPTPSLALCIAAIRNQTDD